MVDSGTMVTRAKALASAYSIEFSTIAPLGWPWSLARKENDKAEENASWMSCMCIEEENIIFIANTYAKEDGC